MKKSASIPACLCLILAFGVLAIQNAHAQAPEKFKFGLKASALYASPAVVNPEPSQVALGGYNPVWGYDVSIFAKRKIWKSISILGQIGNSLQGRSWEGAQYRHHLVYAELGVSMRLIHPVFIEAGLRGGGVVATNDPYKVNMNKGDFGGRLGLGLQFSRKFSLHLDYLRSFTPFRETTLPSGNYGVFRRNFAAGLSYTF
ncbi:MAG TPA: hypothetical protein DCF33_18325 [Saprospirales bacterium]|nr:hypothetical protein [Saprospirales bacterium]